ncbi:hypothetical protein JB92DRAFT_1888561 [Gautieria morchelliformis]|nr:hypothetical protein JB92DRAFT_1888561 [Gautieria morchelliformis]
MFDVSNLGHGRSLSVSLKVANSPLNLTLFSMDVETSTLIISSLRHNIMPNYLYAGYAMLIYDHFLTLDIEVELMWPAPWSVSKVLYIILAYLGFLISVFNPGSCLSRSQFFPFINPISWTASAYHPPSICTAMFKAHAVMIACIMTLAELVLVFRSWAILGKRKMLGIGFIVASVAAIIVSFVLLAHSLEHVKYISDPRPNTRSCFLIQGESQITFVAFIIFTCVDSVIIFMTLYHLRKHARESSSNLVARVYNDGIFCYICMLVFSVVNIIIIAATAAMILTEMQILLHAVLIKRTLLNLRAASSLDRANTMPTSTSGITLSFPTHQQWPSLHSQIFDIEQDPKYVDVLSVAGRDSARNGVHQIVA